MINDEHNEQLENKLKELTIDDDVITNSNNINLVDELGDETIDNHPQLLSQQKTLKQSILQPQQVPVVENVDNEKSTKKKKKKKKRRNVGNAQSGEVTVTSAKVVTPNNSGDDGKQSAPGFVTLFHNSVVSMNLLLSNSNTSNGIVVFNTCISYCDRSKSMAA